jgi:hypothetical protein
MKQIFGIHDNVWIVWSYQKMRKKRIEISFFLCVDAVVLS